MTRPPLLTLAALIVLPGLAPAQELPPEPATSALPADPWFVEVAAERGLPAGPARRNKLQDLDGDGWLDAVVDNDRVHLNVAAPGGGRRFALQPAWALSRSRRRPDPLLLFDADNDGDLDAYLGVGVDKGNPKWKDPGVRSALGLFDPAAAVQLAPGSGERGLGLEEAVIAVTTLDYDHDGRLDLVTASNYRTGGLPYEAFPLRLLRQLPDGRFQDVTAQAGLGLRREPGFADSRRPVYGVSALDVDGNGFQDVLACGYGRQRNLLFLNRGDGTFAEVGMDSGFAGDADQSGAYPEATKRMFRRRFGQDRPDERPFRANGNSFAAVGGDYDQDGDLDLFLAEITHAWAGPSSDRSSLLTNLGGPGLRFHRAPDAMARVHRVPNWNQGDLYAAWLDVDNDTWLDLLLASGDYPDGQYLRLFRQVAPGRFEDLTGPAGLRWENSTQLSLGDYDRDGDVDVLLGNSHMRLPKARREQLPLRPALFENRIGQRRRWLNVRLEGLGPALGGANRRGLGARVELVLGERTLVRELSGGQGHAGQADAAEAAFGLGDREVVPLLRVRWPSQRQTVTELRDVACDQFLLIKESGEVVRLGPF